MNVTKEVYKTWNTSPIMSLEPVSMEKLKKIAKHFGVIPIRIKGTSGIQICKKFNENKYELITWDEFEKILNEKGLQVYVEPSSAFLKIMKKRE